MKKLEELLKLNNLDSEKFYNTVYNSLINSIFEAVVIELDNDSSLKIKTKKRMISSQNRLLTVSNIVKEITGCELSTDEIKYVQKLMHAYFNKKTNRIAYGVDVRKKHLFNQNFKCATCGNDINNANSELDHIIPWSYVGDELGDSNLQMLCIKCNRQKSANVIYNIKKFILK